jgi:hypothetical protein
MSRKSEKFKNSQWLRGVEPLDSLNSEQYHSGR